ncbi:MAG: ABC transporter ATP-binding protein, partial [Candidatus Thermoplasmatota archaeon]
TLELLLTMPITTLQAIVGLLAQDAGRILVNGREMAADPLAYKGALGYMPEAFSLPDYLTGQEFLEYVARLHDLSLPVAQEGIREGLVRFDLLERRTDLINAYSKGMRQKTAFLAATMHEPRLLLLDEPLIGVDPQGQVRLKEVVRALAAKGSGVLVSTHMLDTAERLCDHIAIMHRGHAVAQGTLSELRGLAHARTDSTLEEVFLQLTAEAQVPPPEEPPRRRSLWRRR